MGRRHSLPAGAAAGGLHISQTASIAVCRAVPQASRLLIISEHMPLTSRSHLAGALLAALGTLACSDAFSSSEEKELEEAKARWESAGVVDYEADVRVGCFFCQATLPVFSRVVIRGGQVVSAEPLTPTPGSETISLDAWPTVPELFNIIESASHDADYDQIEAEYDPILGHPTKVTLRCKDNVLDCGAIYELQNLATPLTGS